MICLVPRLFFEPTAEDNFYTCLLINQDRTDLMSLTRQSTLTYLATMFDTRISCFLSVWYTSIILNHFYRLAESPKVKQVCFRTMSKSISSVIEYSTLCARQICYFRVFRYWKISFTVTTEYHLSYFRKGQSTSIRN